MAALSGVLDPTGLNLQLNTQPSGAAGYHIRDGVDWGGKAIQDIVNTGAYRAEDVDGVLAAARIARQIQLPMRVKGTSIDDLHGKMAQLNYALIKASRYQPLDFVVTPSGSTKTTTFKVIGGDTDGPYTNQLENNALWLGQVNLQALPFGYGAKQTLGSSASPLFAAAAGPGSFTVSPTAGSEGDVLADVTIIFQLTVDTVGAVTVGTLNANTGWLVTSDVTGWTAGSGGGTRTSPANAKYKGGAAKGYKVAAVNTIEEAFTQTFTTTNFPAGTPVRILLTADDTQVLAAQRGLAQIRLAVSAGGVTQYGEWTSVPAAAGNGTTTHFMQALDMGTFVFPPGPTGQTGFSGSTTISIQVQDGNLLANTLAVVFDSLIFLPDASSLIAEWPVVAAQPAANTAIRVESDMLYTNSDGSPQTVLLSGSHVRCRGATRYGIWASAEALANSAGDVSFSTVKAWAEYTPRYLSLAPA